MEIILLTLHILGAAALFGAVLFALVLTIKEPVSGDRLKIFQKYGLLGMVAAGWLFVTGILLYLPERAEFNVQPVFWLKIGLFVLDGIIATQLVDRKVRNAIAIQSGKGEAKGLSVWLLANILIITTIISIGVFLVEGH